MIRCASVILLAAVCVLALSTPAAAWEDTPADAAAAIRNGATERSCSSECPAGTVAREYSGAPEFKDCTEAYQYYIHHTYEFMLTTFLQYAPAYGADYLALCRARDPGIFSDGAPVAADIATQADAELAAVRPVMRALIAGPLSKVVPAHCAHNKPAQDEVAAQFDKWFTQSSTYHREKLMTYSESNRPVCGQFIDARVARVYETAFTGMPVLGVTAAQFYLQDKDSAELRKVITDYKAAADSVLKTAPAPESGPAH